MTDILLDTTLFDDLRKGDSEAHKIVEAILEGEVHAVVSPMTVCELWRSEDMDRRVEIGYLGVLRFVKEALPDIEIARTAGLWLTNSHQDTQRDPACIAIVAATATRLGIPICTRDADAFRPFGVEISSY